MIQVQLRPKVSHRHIVPVLVLYLLVVVFGAARGLTEQSSWLMATVVILSAVIVAIVVFYAAMPFLCMMDLKESWFGTKFFQWPISPKKLRRAIVVVGVCLTYFGFVCRIWMISGLEAAFVMILAAATIGSPLNSAHPPSWMLAPLVVLIAAVHAVVERPHLGMAGLIIVADRTKGWL